MKKILFIIDKHLRDVCKTWRSLIIYDEEKNKKKGKKEKGKLSAMPRPRADAAEYDELFRFV